MDARPAPQSEEATRLDAPCTLNIAFRPNLAGIAVRLSNGPSAGDPLDQRGTVRHFSALGAAIDALPELVKAHLAAHDRAALGRRLDQGEA